MKISSIGVLSSSKPISYKSLNTTQLDRKPKSEFHITDNNSISKSTSNLIRPNQTHTLAKRANDYIKHANKYYAQALWDLMYGIENDMQTQYLDEDSKAKMTFDKYGSNYLLRKYDENGVETDFIQISENITYALTHRNGKQEEYIYRNGNLSSYAIGVLDEGLVHSNFEEKFIYDESGVFKKYKRGKKH